MLDMGEPVKIVDLARDMIRLSGLEEGIDIQIEFTGIRPGEKLYEEMFFNDEIAEPTEHPKVLRARNGRHDGLSDHTINDLIDAALSDTLEMKLRVALKQLVPDFVTNATPPAGAHATNGNGVHAAEAAVQPKPGRRPSGEMSALV